MAGELPAVGQSFMVLRRPGEYPLMIPASAC